MQRRAFVILGAAFLAGCAAGTPGSVRLRPGTTLYIVRHGDREGEDLTAKGRQRAQALVGALEGMALDAIYAPGIKRNLDTASPIAAARGLEVMRRPQENPTARLAREAAGKAALWVGNKGNITAIWDGLGLPDPAPLNYGDLAIVRADATGGVTVERRVFGPK
ncbi:histidine phosphatase family protein [Mesobacterium sp. TK19101]|uniref:Histidine phosphatase family protein n=1 Tax=Mesobacterium hydrothermale TaxID=3111907 RepID=A0ABU6HJG4_9RHOB|nr:histidine phosphatase family protein [Mesobacterium sp. TK19101]MEC3861985.1 histidine phosphatase family protein [Mesobacterium sp. TK19101]